MSTNPTGAQVSAGGVAYRQAGSQVEIALIKVGAAGRWQLPKGVLNAGEDLESAALREVREETGLVTALVAPLETIDYWFYAQRGGRRTRFHKFVHFYLLRYVSGDVADHDHEVEDACWVEIERALEQLAFPSEREVVRKARAWIASGTVEGEAAAGNG